MKRRDPRKPTEYQLQTALADHLRLNAMPGVLWLHVPNQQASGPKRGAFLKRMGVMAGAADLLLFRKDIVHDETKNWAHLPTLWIELKAPGKKPTPIQEVFRDRVVAIGHDWHCFDNLDEALALLRRGGWCR